MKPPLETSLIILFITISQIYIVLLFFASVMKGANDLTGTIPTEIGLMNKTSTHLDLGAFAFRSDSGVAFNEQ